MNCVENLPVFTAIILCATATGADSRLLDLLAGAIMAARICQTTVHLTFAPSDGAASVRFAFFFVQATGMLAMALSLILIEVAEIEANVAPRYAASRSNCSASDS
jgi:uncharacterized MAPEG superfamily protein